MGILDKIFDDNDKDKRKADFSDVQSGSSSTAPEWDVTVDKSPFGDSGKMYTVVSGDSLSKIAKREYGDAGKWRKIYEANKDKIKDPDLIYPGQEFTIPNA